VSEPLEHLTLLDLSDREVLLIVRDVADSNGYAYSWAVASQLDLRGETASRQVSSRLSWLTRYGALERGEKRHVRRNPDAEPTPHRGWRLTELGWMIATGKLSKTQERAFEAMKPGALLMATRFISRQIAQANGTGKLLDREYRYSKQRL
jgi:hypothetical protein